MQQSFSIQANLVDIPQQQIYLAELQILQGKIHALQALGAEDPLYPYLLPGFVDSHVHIESSMLTPAAFAEMAICHGTLATVSDPHEIANVCGMEGVDFMINNGASVPFKFCFGAPSCVPATIFETAGAALYAAEVEQLLQRKEIYYLSEVMNFPGVIAGDEDLLAKIAASKAAAKPIDGHAPGLSGEALKQYIATGISSDHECTTYEEALEKLQLGMKVLIREGSAAKNFDALIPLLKDWPHQLMFCSDDKHPDSLIEGHINHLCKRAVAAGIPLFHVLQAACINPVQHYNLPLGLLQLGDEADFILAKDLIDFEIIASYIAGKQLSEADHCIAFKYEALALEDCPNQFSISKKAIADLAKIYPKGTSFPIIEALDGQLFTKRLEGPILNEAAELPIDIAEDHLKMVVVNRYHQAEIKACLIKSFGLKSGALASSIAHDSHNIIAVGCSDEALLLAINEVIKHKGGIAVADGTTVESLALPIAGLMSNLGAKEVAERYTHLDLKVKELGSNLKAPFMTLSFMALLVIPHLKLSDKGLFDTDSFKLLD